MLRPWFLWTIFPAVSLFAQVGFPVWSEDFETEKDDGFYERAARHDNLAVVSEVGVGGSAALRAKYVGYDRGSERIVFPYALPEPLLEATLNFDVHFESDFQFVRGGKLHGFSARNKITGCRDIEPDGWSARAMWRGGASLATYTYHQDKGDGCGDDGSSITPFNFETGKYYALSYHVRVNDPPESSNGFIHAYVDGEMVTRDDNLQLRSVGGDETLIYQVIFETFHGGSSSNWAPRNPDGSYATVHALFDNFEVYSGRHIRETPGMGQVLPLLPPSPAVWPRLCLGCPEAVGAFAVNGRFLKAASNRFLRIIPEKPLYPGKSLRRVGKI